ncbi:S8 family serine peptidase [Patescibacteria group bacterium AH-259-L05]|nr:S8 family serine peptidase [Patescibacteria group bacterium AH-259-L05]
MMWKKYFGAILVISIFFACSFDSPTKPTQEQPETVLNDTTRYIITFETAEGADIAEMIFTTLFGYNIFYVATEIHSLIVDMPRLKTLSKTVSSPGGSFRLEKVTGELRATFTTASGDEFNAMYVEEDDPKMYWQLNTDTYELQGDTSWLWHINMIQADQSWNAGFKGDGVTTIYTDGGLCPDYQSHPAFAAIDTSISFNPYTDSTDIEADKYETNHGSLVFYLGVGQPYPYQENQYLSGVAPGSRAGLVKLFEMPWASRAMAIKATDIAIDFNPDVISMSWGGGGKSPTLQLLFEKAYEKRIVLVAAAGNDDDSPVLYPAGYSQVIAVGAVYGNGEKAYFSNYGQDLEIMAPGVNVTSFYGCEIGAASGTSVSTPLVAGAIALYIQKYRQIRNNAYTRPSLLMLRYHLHNSAEKENMGNNDWTNYMGFGIVKAMNLLAQL